LPAPRAGGCADVCETPIVPSEIVGADSIESTAASSVKRLHDAEIALAGRGGVMAAYEFVVQALEQRGHRQYLL
jgi:hypothetical protein